MSSTSTLPAAEQLVKAPQQRRSQETLQKILGAIASLLEERHFARISMAEIAERAGVSVATLYTRFEDKETLLAYLIAHLQESQLVASEAHFAADRWRGVSLEERVRHLVTFLIAGCEKARGLLRTLTARQMFEERTEAEVERETAALEILVTWLLEGLETGEPRASEKQARMALSLVGSTVRSHLLIGASCGLSRRQLESELVAAVCAYLESAVRGRTSQADD